MIDLSGYMLTVQCLKFIMIIGIIEFDLGSVRCPH